MTLWVAAAGELAPDTEVVLIGNGPERAAVEAIDDPVIIDGYTQGSATPRHTADDFEVACVVPVVPGDDIEGLGLSPMAFQTVWATPAEAPWSGWTNAWMRGMSWPISQSTMAGAASGVRSPHSPA